MSNVRTPTETLVRCLELFGESEPACVMVIWIDSDKKLHWNRSDLSAVQTVGMLECVKRDALDGWMGHESSGE